MPPSNQNQSCNSEYLGFEIERKGGKNGGTWPWPWPCSSWQRLGSWYEGPGPRWAGQERGAVAARLQIRPPCPSSSGDEAREWLSEGRAGPGPTLTLPPLASISGFNLALLPLCITCYKKKNIDVHVAEFLSNEPTNRRGD